MKLYRTTQQLIEAPLAGTSLCIGVFDGVHRGHQMLLARTLAHARLLDVPSLVLTFANHPLSVLAPPYAPPMLTTAEEKTALLSQYGADLCLMLDFDPTLAIRSPREFLDQIVIGTCRARHLVCGGDFRFGAQGGGDVKLLERLAPDLGFGLEVCEDLMAGNAPVRSSRIRAHLLEGDVAEARVLLGRPYALAGRVVPGDHRGRTIGYPTANIEPPSSRLVPRNGVYAVTVDDGERRLGGMLNIGVRPTFQTHERAIEVHLFDFEEDLYGRELSVHFLARIRDERRFASVEDLVIQLRDDEAASRALIATG